MIETGLYVTADVSNRDECMPEIPHNMIQHKVNGILVETPKSDSGIHDLLKDLFFLDPGARHRREVVEDVTRTARINEKDVADDEITILSEGIHTLMEFGSTILTVSKQLWERYSSPPNKDLQ